MSEFRFEYPVVVRYGDLDPQGHLNNARYLTYMEQARLAYVLHLDLWDGRDFMESGLITADAHVKFIAPVLFRQTIKVGVRISRLGNKSFTTEYRLAESESDKVVATGTVIMVAYDYHLLSSIPIPDRWRQIIAAFENIPEMA